ncbi:MAG: PEP-CTERM sorting domain-containing protein [Rubrivivax sp.]
MKRLALALFGSVVLASNAGASMVGVTPSNPQGWEAVQWYWDGTNYTNTGTGASAGITTTYARSGLGSVQITLADEGTSEADWYYKLPTPSALANLTALGFDWYTSSASTTPAFTAPALALYVESASNSAYLIWEAAYNGFSGSVPQDTWNTSNVLNNQFWSTCGGTWQLKTLAEFNSACFGGDGSVTYLTTFLGFGYAGTSFDGAVDNVTIGFGTSEATVFNFEPDATSVPEPISLLLVGAGLVSAGALRRRTRRAQRR